VCRGVAGQAAGIRVPRAVGRGHAGEVALGSGGVDGAVNGRGIPRSAPGIVRNPGAVVGGIADGGGDLPVAGGVAVVVEDFHGHDRYLPVHAGYADAVVAHGADGARGVRPVAVAVEGVVVVAGEIPADDVVHV